MAEEQLGLPTIDPVIEETGEDQIETTMPPGEPWKRRGAAAVKKTARTSNVPAGFVSAEEAANESGNIPVPAGFEDPSAPAKPPVIAGFPSIEKKSPAVPKSTTYPSNWVDTPAYKYVSEKSALENKPISSFDIKQWMVDEVSKREKIDQLEAQAKIGKYAPIKSLEDAYKEPLSRLGVADPATFTKLSPEELSTWYRNKKSELQQQLADIDNATTAGMIPAPTNLLGINVRGISEKLSDLVTPGSFFADRDAVYNAKAKQLDELEMIRKQIISPKVAGTEPNNVAAGLETWKATQPGMYATVVKTLAKGTPIYGKSMALPEGESALSLAWKKLFDPQKYAELTAKEDIPTLDNPDDPTAVTAYIRNRDTDYLSSVLGEQLVYELADQGLRSKMIYSANEGMNYANSFAVAKSQLQSELGRINDRKKTAKTAGEKQALDILAKQANDHFASNPDVIQFLKHSKDALNARDAMPALLDQFPSVKQIEQQKQAAEQIYNDQDVVSRSLLGSPFGSKGSYGLMGSTEKSFVEAGKEVMKFLNMGAASLGIKDPDQAYFENYTMDQDFDSEFYTPSGAQPYKTVGYKDRPASLDAMVNVLGLDEKTFEGIGGTPITKFNAAGIPTMIGQTLGNVGAQAILTKGIGGALGGISTRLGQTSLVRSMQASPLLDNPYALGLKATDAAGIIGSTYATTYAQNFQQGIKSGLSQSDAEDYANISSLGTALTEMINPDVQYLNKALGRIDNAGIKAVSDALKNTSIKPGQRVVNGITTFVTNVGKETAEEVADVFKQHGLDAVYQIDSNGLSLAEDIKQTTIQTAIGMIPLGILGAKGNNNRLQKESLWYVGENPDAVRDYYSRQLEGIDDPYQREAIEVKANNAMKIANTMNEIITTASRLNNPDRPLTPQERMTVAQHLFNARKLNADAATVKDNVIKEQIEENAKQENTAAAAIVKGSTPAYIVNGESMERDRFERFMTDPDFTENREAFELRVDNDPEMKALAAKAQEGMITDPTKVTALRQVQAKQASLKKSIAAYNDKLATGIEGPQKEETEQLRATAETELETANEQVKKIKSAPVGPSAPENVTNFETGANIQQPAEKVTPGTEITQPLQQPTAGRALQVAANQPLPWAPVKSPQNNARPDVVGSQVQGNFQQAPKVVSNTSRIVTLPGSIPGVGRRLKVRLALFPEWAVTPSHSPETFETNPGFPLLEGGQNPNQRDYKTTSNQQQVFQQALSYDERALEDLPIVDPRGFVASGNGRTMAGQLAVQSERNFSDQRYLEELQNRLPETPFSPQDYNFVAAAGSPRLGYIVEDELPITTEMFSAFNVRREKSVGAVENAVALRRRVQSPQGQRVMEVIMDQVDNALADPETNLATLYTRQPALRQVFRSLVDGGFIETNELGDYYNNETGITDKGKDYIETLLLSNIVSEKNMVLLNQPGVKNYRTKLIGSMRNLTAIENLTNPDLRLAETINNAIQLKYDETNYDGSVEDMLASQALPGMGQSVFSGDDLAMYYNLEQTSKEFRDFTKRYLSVANLGGTAQEVMFAEEKANNRTEVIERLAQNFTNAQQQAIQQAETNYRGQQSIGAETNAPGLQQNNGQPQEAAPGTATRRAGTPIAEQPAGQQPGQEAGQQQPAAGLAAAEQSGNAVITNLQPGATQSPAAGQQPGQEAAVTGQVEYTSRNLPAPVADFEVVQVIPYTEPEANKFTPNQQLKFNQGTFEPVRIVGNEDLIELIQIGSRRVNNLSAGKDKKQINAEREKQLEKNIGINSVDAYNEARRLAKQNRSRTTENIIIIGQPQTTENANQETPLQNREVPPQSGGQSDQGTITQPEETQPETEGGNRAENGVRQETLTTMDGTPPNDAGVFSAEGADGYTLADPRKDWQGVPRAEVKVIQLNNGNWIASYQYNTPTGGYTTPLTDSNDQFPSRSAAVIDALDKLDQRVEGNAELKKWVRDTRAKVPAPSTAQTPAAANSVNDIVARARAKMSNLRPPQTQETGATYEGEIIQPGSENIIQKQDLANGQDAESYVSESDPIYYRQLDIFTDQPPNTQASTNEVQRQGDTGRSYVGLDKLAPGEMSLVERQFKEAGNFSFTARDTTVKSTADVAYIFRNLTDEAVEQSFFVVANKKGDYFVQWLGMGSVTAVTVDPLIANAAVSQIENPTNAWLVHNHPSGNLKTSGADVGVLRKYQDLFKSYGIRVDGIVMDLREGKYVSFDGFGEMVFRPEQGEAVANVPVHTFSKQVFASNYEPASIYDAEDAAAYLSKERYGVGDKAGIIVMNSGNDVVGNYFVDPASPTFTRDVMNRLTFGGGKYVIVYTNNQNHVDQIKAMAETITNADAKLIDVIMVAESKGNLDNYTSLANEGLLNEPGSTYGNKQQQLRNITPEIRELAAVLQGQGLTPDQVNEQIANIFAADIPSITTGDVAKVLTPAAAAVETPNAAGQSEAIRGVKTPAGYNVPEIFGMPTTVYNEAIERVAMALDQGQDLPAAINEGISHIQRNGGGWLNEFRRVVRDALAGNRPRGRTQVGGGMEQALTASRRIEQDYRATGDGPIPPGEATDAQGSDDLPLDSGIDKKSLNVQRARIGLPPLPDKINPVKSMAMLDQETKQAMANGIDVPDILDNIATNKNYRPQPFEQNALNLYLAAMEVRLGVLQDKLFQSITAGDPAAISQARALYEDTFKEYDYASKTIRSMGSDWGLQGRLMQPKKFLDESLSNLLERLRVEANLGEEPTREQQERVEKEAAEIQRTHKELNLSIEQQMEKDSREEAEKYVEELKKKAAAEEKSGEKRASKKTKAQSKYNEARLSIRDKLRKRREGKDPGDTSDPGSTVSEPSLKYGNSGPVPMLDHDTLAELSPDIKQMVDALYEDPDGPRTVEAIVEAIKADLIDDIPQITNRNIRDMITGYGLPTVGKTRSDLQKEKDDIQTEMRRINELEDLQSGVNPPKTSRARKRQSDRIKQLEVEIKEEYRVRELTQQIEDLQKGTTKNKIPKQQGTKSDRIKQLEAILRQEQKKRKLANQRSSPADQTLSRLSSYYAGRLRDITKRINEGDYSPMKKERTVQLDDRTKKLRDDYYKARETYETNKEKDRLSRLTLKKDWRELSLMRWKQVRGTAFALKASLDLSFLLRQGIKLGITHPAAWLEMTKKGARWWLPTKGAQESYDNWHRDLTESDFFKEVVEPSGLFIADQKSPQMNAREEFFTNNFLENIPDKWRIGRLFKGSERSYSGGMNVLRMEVFRAGANQLDKAGYTMENSKEKYESLANYVNDATGRGDLTALGISSKSTELFNTIFFAPSFMASRINTINPFYYAKLKPAQRVAKMIDFGAFLAFNFAVLALAKYGLGADVEDDPTSPDFMKARIGDTTVDFWAGYQSYVTMVSRIALSRRENRELSGQDQGNLVNTFVRGKLAPIPGTVVNLLYGKTVIGEPVNLTTGEGAWNFAKGLAVPMIAVSVYEGVTSKDKVAGTAGAVLSALGASVGNYPKKQTGSKKRLQLRLKKPKLKLD